MRTFTITPNPKSPATYDLHVHSASSTTKSPVTTLILQSVSRDYLEGYVAAITTAEVEQYEGAEVRSLRRALHTTTGLIA